MHSTRGVAKTARLEWTEAACKFHEVYWTLLILKNTDDLLNDPFFPALTRHSRNQTPKLGKGSLGPRKFSTLAKVHKLESVAVKPVIEEKLDFEGIMYVVINPPFKLDENSPLTLKLFSGKWSITSIPRTCLLCKPYSKRLPTLYATSHHTKTDISTTNSCATSFWSHPKLQRSSLCPSSRDLDTLVLVLPIKSTVFQWWKASLSFLLLWTTKWK